MLVLMEGKYTHTCTFDRLIINLCIGAPRNIDTEAVENDLRELKDVEHAHNIHIWSLTVNKAAIAAHLAIS